MKPQPNNCAKKHLMEKLMRYIVTTNIEFSQKKIRLETRFQDDIDRNDDAIQLHVINTQEEAFKKALILLGWTPPPTTEDGK